LSVPQINRFLGKAIAARRLRGAPKLRQRASAATGGADSRNVKADNSGTVDNRNRDYERLAVLRHYKLAGDADTIARF